MRDDAWERLIERVLESQGVQIKAQQAEIDKLKAWRNWCLGAAAALGLFIGAFAEQIKKAMGFT